jgi:prefoldin subunit 5
MYDSPRDTAPQLEKFVEVLASHRQQLESQLEEIQANLDEVKQHEREAKALLNKHSAKSKRSTPTVLSE